MAKKITRNKYFEQVWLVCYIKYYMWQCSHNGVNLMLTDDLVHIWCQDMCKHQDNIIWLAFIRRAPAWYGMHPQTKLQTTGSHLVLLRNIFPLKYLKDGTLVCLLN